MEKLEIKSVTLKSAFKKALEDSFIYPCSAEINYRDDGDVSLEIMCDCVAFDSDDFALLDSWSLHSSKVCPLSSSMLSIFWIGSLTIVQSLVVDEL